MALYFYGAGAIAAELADSEARQFFNDRGCNACHGIDEPRLGPAFQLVAQRYRDAGKQEVERLALKIRYGGAGAWGTVPMVSYPGLTTEQALPVVRWILALDAEQSRAPQTRP